ncbi:MAG TPA: M12 family metallo-peptidase [Candidatus Binatia bacterium]|nr:M12 family metallo-peptidase [Candidatus Binatia bacterium]
MTTRRRIICFILSALFIASCSLFGPDPPQRIVRVRALADVSFRQRNAHWAEEARGLIEAASDYYEREFDIRLVTEKVAAWPENERIPSTPELLARMKREFAGQAQSYDLLVAFTAASVSRIFAAGRPRVDRIGDCAQGLSRFMVVPINQIFRYAGPQAEPELDVIALIHEIGHVFGAVHVQDHASIMHEEFGYRTEFDAKNRATIQKNRLCPFAK